MNGLGRELKGTGIDELWRSHGMLVLLLTFQPLCQPHTIVFELVSFQLVELGLNKIRVR